MTDWPWPLDGVQDWFEGLAETIFAGVKPMIDALASTILPVIEGVAASVWGALPLKIRLGLTFLWELAGKAWSTLWDFISDPIGTIQAGLDWVVAQVGDTLADISTAIGGVAAEVWDTVSGTLSAISTAIGDVAAGVWDALPEEIKTPIMWLSDLAGKAWTMLWDFVEDPVGSIQSGLDALSLTVTTAFDGAMETVGGWVGEALAGVAGALGEALNGFITWLLGALSWIADAIVGAATAIKDVIAQPIIDFGTAIAEGLLEALVPGSPDEKTKKTVDEFAKKYLERMTELAPKKASPLPELPALLASAAGVVSLNILTALGGQGVGVAIDQAHPIKNMGIRAMVGDIVDSFQMPAMVGPLLASPVWPGIIIPLRYRMNEMFPNMIPDAPDLIRFMVFEVIDRGVFEEYMGYHGYSTMIAGWFYEGHWVLLPLGEVKDARHRGLINDAELAKFLVLHDYRPEPRPGIRTSDRDIAAELVWDLPGRIEARWMFRWGIKDRDGLKELLIKGGLDPEYADDAADAVAMNQFLREIRMQETNIKADLRDGYILEVTARADLAEIGYPEPFIDYHVKDALKDRERSHKKELLSYYRDCYLTDIPTEPPFEKAVHEILVVAEAADLFIERTYIKKHGKKAAG